MSKSQLLPILHIEAKPSSGKPRIAGKGVTVQFLASFVNHPEWPVERICEEFSLTPAEVYAAWSYYYDNKEEIDAHIREAQSAAEKHMADAEYQSQVAKLLSKAREKLP